MFDLAPMNAFAQRLTPRAKLNLEGFAYSAPLAVSQEISEKKKWVAFFLCLFLGFFGIHRLYVRKIGTGIAYFFTLGGLGVGWFLDLVNILQETFTDKAGGRLESAGIGV